MKFKQLKQFYFLFQVQQTLFIKYNEDCFLN